MKALKIILVVAMLQATMHVRANTAEDFANIVGIILGAKLLEGVIDKVTGENEENVGQDYDSNNSRVDSNSSNTGTLGFKFYNKGLQQCKYREYDQALKWFRKSKQQGYIKSVDKVFKSCSGKNVQDFQNTSNIERVFNAKRTYDLYNECEINRDNGFPYYTCISGQYYYEGRAKTDFSAKWRNVPKLYPKPTLNDLKINYTNRIAIKVKNNWRYMGAKDGWGCDVYILQDVSGNVQSVSLKSCSVDNNAKIKSFKNSIERAVYKASPLPPAPYYFDQSVFNREIIFNLAINSSNKHESKSTNITENESSSFSDLWGKYGGSILDSNNENPSKNVDSSVVSTVDTQPPVISFNHRDSMSVNDKRVIISGVIKDSSKITEFLIKGKEVAIDENGNFSISRYIRLGRNTFDIVALDAFGNKVTKVITITRQKEVAKNLDKPLDLPSFKGRRDENAVALIIGLDKYETITNAPWAESDAFVFYDYAQQSLGISADRISLITGNQSDRSGIWKSLDRWLPTMVEKNDSNVYVYFAGHGLASADGKEAYLLPYDGDPDMLDRTAIPRQEVIDGLKDLKARSVTLFMDTCYSGTPKGGNGTLVADSRGLRIIKKNSFSALPKNFTIFSAASNDETASSHPTLDNGLFSYWMMRGLGGEADNNNDRKITNGELHKFINKNVKKAAVLMGRKQNSQLVGDVDRVIASW